MAVNIQLEWTPNPSTLKYVIDRNILPRGAINFTTKEKAAERSPLAKKLMDIPGVTAVMLGVNFATITKGDDGEWDEVNDQVMAIIDGHLTANEPVVTGEPEAPAAEASGGSDIEQRIRVVLDNEIRPAVAQDGGDITLDRFEDGLVYLHMQGSCAGCPSSTMTLKMGIESRLRELIPEVREVVSV